MSWWRRRPDSRRPIDADLQFYSRALRSVATKESATERVFKLMLRWIVFIYAVWCLWDRNFGEYPSSATNIYPLNTRVASGGVLTVHFEVIRHRVCRTQLTWSVTDATGKRKGFTEPLKEATGTVGRDPNVTRDFDLPDMASGPAKLRIITSWACPDNLYEVFYPMTRILDPIDFTVVRDDPARDSIP